MGPARRPDEPLTDRHRNLAWATQAVYEDAFFNLLTALQRRSGQRSIALAGGCAYNSVANGKIRDRTRFQHSYLQSAAGDAGGAIGAAFAVWHRHGKRTGEMTHAYWGPRFTEAEIERLLSGCSTGIASQGCTIRRFDDDRELLETVARAIADGLVVGWFQGRMEWGPRALGNRSILGDPRRDDMKDILNLKIKRRKSFRPFAPSVLRESVSDWFARDEEVPFMLQVLPDSTRAAQPNSGSHPCRRNRQIADGEPRHQSPLLRPHPSIFRLTGVPMVLNTSFNENEPVVCRPEEAFDCFLRTKMDVLVLGDHLVSRLPQATADFPNAA